MSEKEALLIYFPTEIIISISWIVIHGLQCTSLCLSHLGQANVNWNGWTVRYTYIMSHGASPQIASDEKVGLVNYLWDEFQYFVPAGIGIQTTYRELSLIRQKLSSRSVLFTVWQTFGLTPSQYAITHSQVLTIVQSYTELNLIVIHYSCEPCNI